MKPLAGIPIALLLCLVRGQRSATLNEVWPEQKPLPRQWWMRPQ